MKPMKTITLLLAGIVIAGFVAAKPADAGVSFDFFYSNLSPHGNWQVSASYGRVWQPSIYRTGWNPYYDGHWAYTDVGWAWDSDYEWGSIPYHYGTWAYDDYYGWVWVPGYTWAPSWVTFREGPGYIGWAPVSPRFSIGVSFSFGHFPSDHFVFVRSGDFLCNRVRSYAVPTSVTNIIINKTKIINNNITIVNNTVVNHGPSLSFVESATHRHVQAVSIDRVHGTSLPGQGFSRAAIRVRPEDVRRGLRAAEPVSASRRLPSNGAAINGQQSARPARGEGFTPRGGDTRGQRLSQDGQDGQGLDRMAGNTVRGSRDMSSQGSRDSREISPRDSRLSRRRSPDATVGAAPMDSARPRGFDRPRRLDAQASPLGGEPRNQRYDRGRRSPSVSDQSPRQSRQQDMSSRYGRPDSGSGMRRRESGSAMRQDVPRQSGHSRVAPRQGGSDRPRNADRQSGSVRGQRQDRSVRVRPHRPH